MLPLKIRGDALLAQQAKLFKSPMTAEPNLASFRGSMKAGMFTAQIGVALDVSPASIVLRAPGRSYRIDRENLAGLADTSLFGLFKRGIRFVHRQPGLPSDIVFYPSIGREALRKVMADLGWDG